jgi:hypothetical protein
MKPVMIFIALTLASQPIFAAEQAHNGMITDVIVYHGQALVTRTIELQEMSGDIELLIENLPDRILPESLYAQSNHGIQVLSVRYRVKEIEKDIVRKSRPLMNKLNPFKQKCIKRSESGSSWYRCGRSSPKCGI